MKWNRSLLSALLVAVLGLNHPVGAASDLVVSAQVGASLKAGSEQLDSKNYAAAMGTFRQGLQASGLSDFERFSYHRLMIGAAFGAQDYAQSMQSAEWVLQSNFLDPAEKSYVQQTLLNSTLQLKEYAKAQAVLEQLLINDPSNQRYLQLKTRTAYFSQQFEKSLASARAEVMFAQKAGTPPSEETLKILSDSATNLDDEPAYTEGLMQLVRFYPTVDYWSDLLYRKLEQGAFKDAGELHFYRLLKATDAWREAGEFIDAAEVFIKAGFPLEAQAALNAGKEKGLLPNAELSKIYKEKVSQVEGLVKQDSLMLKDISKMAGKLKPNGLLSNGYNLVVSGQTEAGLDMMENALVQGLKEDALATLTLGEALVLANRFEMAENRLESIRIDGEVGVVAQLWLLTLGK